MKYFEFVCTRNEWRSPVAEFIAQWYLNEKWLSQEYGAKSSWSHRQAPDPNEVQSTSDNNIPFESLKTLIEMWIKQKIYSLKEEEIILQNIQQKNTEKLKVFFNTANKVFKDQERYFRADAIHKLVEEKWLYWYLKANSNQTTQNNDIVAIFAMAPNNTQKVREIYKNYSNQPLIETLSVYATWDQEATLPNAFAQWEKFYHNVIDQLLEQIPLAINRYIKENTN